VDVCHCEMCAMLRTKESSTDTKHTNVQEKEDSSLNECNVLKNGKVCFSENNELFSPWRHESCGTSQFRGYSAVLWFIVCLIQL